MPDPGQADTPKSNRFFVNLPPPTAEQEAARQSARRAVLRGIDHAVGGRHEDAVAAYREALKLGLVYGADHLNATLLLAHSLSAAGKKVEAVQAYRSPLANKGLEELLYPVASLPRYVDGLHELALTLRSPATEQLPFVDGERPYLASIAENMAKMQEELYLAYVSRPAAWIYKLKKKFKKPRVRG